MATAVTDNPEESRYEITLDGNVVGFIQYHARSSLIAFVHTEMDDSVSGQGLGSKLVQQALDDARSKGRQVLPFCPFVNEYISRHPEYAELVPENHRKEFGL